MSKLTGNQEFNGNVYIKGVGGYNGTNPAAATDLATQLAGSSVWVRGTGSGSAVLSGSGVQATGQFAVAQGIYTVASGSYSHAEGVNAKASGNYSHAEGQNTTASGELSHAEGRNTVAFGGNSHAEGMNTVASGSYSHAEGHYTTASGEYSHAEGDTTEASGFSSHAEGSGSVSSGTGSHVEGWYTTASGKYSHAEGYSTVASGDRAHAEGQQTVASGSNSHAEGNSTEASGSNSHAEGIGTVASGQGSHAEGNYTRASGYGSHAEGNGTVASSDYSHAEGQYTTASGVFSHAEGQNTMAPGQYSHAEGQNTTASGYYSHAEGYKTVASNNSEHAQGKYNATAFGQIFSIGVGDNSSQRKNAISIITGSGTKSSASIYIYGVGGYDGTNPSNSTPANELIGSFSAEVTWSDLKTMRDNGDLIPGLQYRITDYNTTTVQENTQAAGHQFDIIVVADDNHTLNEKARAVKHAGDTYFSRSALEAWELKYDIDNDTTKYSWADSGSNGRGVIYWMKDEWNNECPYDFKNIQFKRKLTNGVYDPTDGTDEWVYTFNAYNQDNDDIEDASVIAGRDAIEDGTEYCYSNVIRPSYTMYAGNMIRRTLNGIVFLNLFDIPGATYFECYSNVFGDNCQNNIFGSNCYNNTFENYCRGNTFGNYCHDNTFGNSCLSNTFGQDCYNNTFGDNCQNNTFGSFCNHNTFGNHCGYNIFVEEFNCNTFGIDCNYISIGSRHTEHTVVETGNRYIRLTSSVAPSEGSPLRNITIAQGVNNVDVWQTITHPTVGDTYRTVYQPSGSRVVDVYNGGPE